MVNALHSASSYPFGVLYPPPATSYWYETKFKGDPHFDHDAAARSAEAVPIYLERLRQEQKAAAPYPPRLIHNPMTALPAFLNGYLPRAEAPAAGDHFVELATEWLHDPLVSLGLLGLEPDELFAPSALGGRPCLGRSELLRSSLSQADFTHLLGPDASRGEAQHLYLQQWCAGQWPVYGGQVALHGRIYDSRVAVSSSFLPVRRDAQILPRLDVAAAFEIATEVFKAEIKGFLEDGWEVILAPYAGSGQFILPFGDRILLACRLEAHSELGDDAYRIFIDAGDSAGQVLGPIERLVSQVNAFYLETSAAAAAPAPAPTTDAVLSLLDLQNALDPYLQGMDNVATGLPLVLAGFSAPFVPPVVDTELEASNIAYHAWQTLGHFISACGADGSRLLGYDYQFQQRQGFGIGMHTTTVQLHQSPPLRFLVGKPALGALEMGFNPASAKNPKRITFETLAAPLPGPTPGSVVHNPSLDPEVIQHEMAHALMWLLNPAPFDQPNATVPFTRALLEGYASYFARSLAARHLADANQNPDSLWAGATYREGQGWDDTWSFARTSAVIGADLLAAPNAYPGNAIAGLPMYELGMVWARALWDLRVLLLAADQAAGANLADTLALDGYHYCHGIIASFQVAAEGVFDSAQQRGLAAPLLQAIRSKFVNRGICAP